MHVGYFQERYNILHVIGNAILKYPTCQFVYAKRI